MCPAMSDDSSVDPPDTAPLQIGLLGGPQCPRVSGDPLILPPVQPQIGSVARGR